MKKLIFVCFVCSFISSVSIAQKPKVLVFSKNTSYYHESIPDGVAAIQRLGASNNYNVDTTTNASKFNDENLKQYAAVIFLNTADEKSILLTDEEKEAFKHFIESGKGYVGIHAAADAEYEWPWYNGLVGAYFNGHPDEQEAELHVVDKKFIGTKNLPETWKKFDEWYNYKQTHWDSVHVILTVDEKSYKGGTNGEYHPMCWYHTYDGGRSFYLGLGHTKESYTDELFLKILSGGIKYAIGKS